MAHRISIVLVFFLFRLCTPNFNSNDVECDGNCYTGFGVKKWNDGGYLKGNWKDGELTGYGKEFFGSTSEFAGDTYAGEFGEGGYSGYGTYYSKRSDGTHVGYWKKGKPNGYGKVTFNVHSSKPFVNYEGGWKDGRYEGFGEMHFDDGKTKYRYVGNFVNAFFDGMGDFYAADGTHYHGHFAKGYKDGKGVFYFADGSKYEGFWIQDQSEGFEEFKLQTQPLAYYFSTDSAYYFAVKHNTGASEPAKIVRNSEGMFKFKLYQKHIEIIQAGKIIDCSIINSKSFTNSTRYYLLDKTKNHFQISIYADAMQIARNEARIEFDELNNQDHPLWLYTIPAIKQQ